MFSKNQNQNTEKAGGSVMENFAKPQKPMFQKSDKKSRTKSLLTLVLIALVFIAPFVFQGFGQIFMVRVLAVVGLYIILALGLNIVVGYAGLLDFGHIAFYAVGAYVAMIVGTPVAKLLGSTFGGLSYFIALPAGGLVAACVGLLLGLPVLRLRGDYLAIVTLAFGEIVRICLTNNIFGITNGASGLPAAGQALPDPFGLAWLKLHTYFTIGDNFVFTFTSNVYWYIIIAVLILVAIVVVRRQDDSRLGRSWAALREDDVAASAMGVDLTKAKLYAFALGAFWGGIAGVTFSYFQAFVSPESFTFLESSLVLAIVIIGGMGSIPGVLVGAFVIQGIPEFIRGIASSGLLDSIGIHLSAEKISDISSYRMLILGALMVFMMAVRPEGIFPSKRLARELHHIEAVPVVESPTENAVDETLEN
ncbi:MAG: ABC transporter ATP-binding protein [Coriobacteriia bacterium]|nr:ABC transporter ATP-binding protein [Coriobacteriia bacterium]